MFGRAGGTKPKLRPLSAETLHKIVQMEILDASDFISSDLAIMRMNADKYYQGETSVPHEEGRSAVIITAVRDGVNAVLPSIARIFTQNDVVAEFYSDDEEDQEICRQATLYVNSVYHKFGGYQCIIHGTTDALKAKVGVVKVQLEKQPIGGHTISDELTQDELDEVDKDENSELTEISEPISDPLTGEQRWNAVVRRQSYKNVWHLDPVPPEEFIISRGATTIESARLVGTLQTMRVYEAVAMGLDPDELFQHAGSTFDGGTASSEDQERKKYYDGSKTLGATVLPDDWMSQDVTIGDIYLRIDADGDGYAELRRIITAGSNFDILFDEPTYCVPLAAFKDVLQPHMFFPISMAEDLMQDQDAQTALFRSILDNAALTNSPQRAINENMANLEDAKNGEIGAIIRTKGPNAIEELTVPFMAGTTLPVLEYMGRVSEQRTGITKLSQGLNPDALQSTTKIAANAAIAAADARLEMKVRNIGETGIKDLFLIIMKIAMTELKGEQSVRTADDKFEDVYPDLWHDHVSVRLGVGLGNGRIEEKSQAIDQIIPIQTQIMMTLGMANPICGWVELRNTLKKKLALAGYKNVGEFFKAVPPEMLQKIDADQAAKAAAANQGPPAPDLVGAEKIKTAGQIQINREKLQQQGTIKAAEITQKGEIEGKQLEVNNSTDVLIEMMKDDRERDAQEQDYAVAAKKVELDNETKRHVAAENAKARPAPGAAA